MNVFEQYLSGKITANQLRDVVANEGPKPTETPANLSNEDQWRGASFDGRRQSTYDRRIDQELHSRNNANPFASVAIDPVRDQLSYDQNYGGSNAFSRVNIAEYDPVLAQREHDITTQQGRYEVEQPRTFADVRVAPKPPVNVEPLDDTRTYQDQTYRNEETLRREMDYETHYNPVHQKPLW